MVGGRVFAAVFCHGLFHCMVIRAVFVEQCPVPCGRLGCTEFRVYLCEVVVCGQVFRFDLQRLPEPVTGFLQQFVPFTLQVGAAHLPGLLEQHPPKLVHYPDIPGKVKAAPARLPKPVVDDGFQRLAGFLEVAVLAVDQGAVPGDGPGGRGRFTATGA